MSEIVKSEYNALDEQGNYKTHYFKTSADQVVGLGRLKNTEYQVNDVVYSDTNNKVALKCITGGTTSNTELNVSTKAIGSTVTDGGVVWVVIARSNVLDENGVVPIANGGTGASNASGARTNLGLNTAITGASISGKVITLTFADGTTKTLTTQDTNTNNISASSNSASWYIKFSNGFVVQGGKIANAGKGSQNTVTLPCAVTNYSNGIVLMGQYSSATNTSYTGSGTAWFSSNTQIQVIQTSSAGTGINWVAFSF